MHSRRVQHWPGRWASTGQVCHFPLAAAAGRRPTTAVVTLAGLRHDLPRLISGGSRQHDVVVVGGGTAGLAVSHQLLRAMPLDLAIVEPSTKHYYQPGWTMVGGGIFDKKDTVRYAPTENTEAM